MAGRNTQILRVVKAFQLLETSRFGLSTKQIWDELQQRGWEVTQRTVYRDLEALEAAGFPLTEIKDDSNQGSRWKIKADTSLGQHFNLSSSEMLALYIARSYVQGMKNSPFYDDIQAIFQKISDKLGEKAQNYLKELEDDIHVDHRSATVQTLNEDIIETCRAACSEDQWLAVTYTSANSGKTRHRELGPITLYFGQGGYYLIALDKESEQVKTFALSRMSHAQMLDKIFDKPDFNIDEYFSDGFGVYKGHQKKTVRLKVSGPRSHFVAERSWHQSQKVIHRTPHEVTLSFELDPTPEFCSWILSLGSSVEVLEPKDLREQIHLELEQMLKLSA